MLANVAISINRSNPESPTLADLLAHCPDRFYAGNSRPPSQRPRRCHSLVIVLPQGQVYNEQHISYSLRHMLIFQDLIVWALSISYFYTSPWRSSSPCHRGTTVPAGSVLGQTLDYQLEFNRPFKNSRWLFVHVQACARTTLPTTRSRCAAIVPYIPIYMYYRYAAALVICLHILPSSIWI